MVPICWDSIATYAGSFFRPGAWTEIRTNTGADAPYSGSKALYLSAGYSNASVDTLMIISPRFSGLVANNKRIRFYASTNNINTTSKLIIGTMDSPTDTSLNPIDTISFTSAFTYHEIEVTFNALTGYNGTDEYIYLMHDLGGNNNYISIDDFVYFEISPTDIELIDMVAPINNINKCFTASEGLSVKIVSLGTDSLDFSIDTAVVTVNVTGITTQTLVYTIDDNSLNNGLFLGEKDSLIVPLGAVDMSSPGAYYFDIALSMRNDGTASNNNFQDTVLAHIGGNVVGSDSICMGDSVNLFIENYVGNIQWQSGTGGVFTDIPNAIGTSIFVTPNTTMDYRAHICGTSYSDTLTIEPINLNQPIAFDSTLIIDCGDTGTIALFATSSHPNAKFEWYDVPVGGNPLRVGDSNIVGLSMNGDTLYYRGSSSDSSKPIIDTLYVQEVMQTSSLGVNSVLITEIDLNGPPEIIEIQNVTAQTIDVTGWKVAISDNMGTNINQIHPNVQTLNGIIMPGETMTWSDLTTSYTYWGGGINWTHLTEGWIMILDNKGNIIDAVFFNWTSNAIQLLSTTIDGFPVTVGNEWIGNGINPNSHTTSIQRIGMNDNNNSSDFTIQSISYDALNPGLQYPFPGGVCVSTRDTSIVIIDCLVGMKYIENNYINISIHPNPSNGIFHIIGNGVEEEVEISIYNINGKLLYESGDKFSNNFDERIDISEFAKGLYFVKLQGKHSFEMRKIIIN